MKVLRGGMIVDGTGANPMFKGDVHVDGASIAAVLPWAGDDAEPSLPADAEVVDCDGKIVAPGWIDQHTHFGGFAASAALAGWGLLLARSSPHPTSPLSPS